MIFFSLTLEAFEEAWRMVDIVAMGIEVVAGWKSSLEVLVVDAVLGVPGSDDVVVSDGFTEEGVARVDSIVGEVVTSS